MFNRIPQVVPGATLRVMVVDDLTTSRMILAEVARSLDPNVVVHDFAAALNALAWAVNKVADLVLVDYRMPSMDGIDFLRQLRLFPGYAHVPVVMVTGTENVDVRYLALDEGATDFLTKPLDAKEAQVRCRNLLTLRKQQLILEGHRKATALEVEQAERKIRSLEEDVFTCLIRACEQGRGDDTSHGMRVARLASLVSREMGMDEDYARDLGRAARVHDIGLYCVPQQVLDRAGPLSTGEWDAMHNHPQIGHDILKEGQTRSLKLGAEVALCHHERVDGSGYPYGKTAREIPLSARIVAVADAYEFLTSDRPYHRALGEGDALEKLRSERGARLDGEVVAALAGVTRQYTLIKYAEMPAR